MFIDIGVNFHSNKILGQEESLLARAREANVQAIFATGTSLAASNMAVSLARKHNDVYATAGVHPHDAVNWTADVAGALESLWRDSKVVAVGETGLDYDRMFSPREAQRVAFEAQLDAAVSLGLPLFLHCRDAFADFLAMVESAAKNGARGVVHCFTGTMEEAEAYLELGFDIGITGWITDPVRGQSLRAAVPHISINRLHLESDAPHLRPKTAPRGHGNEPALLHYIAHEIAVLRGDMSADAVAKACTANSIRLFRLPCKSNSSAI